jgi:hypothetical protein
MADKMVIVDPPTKSEPPRHDVALWAGVAAFFGSLLAIGIFDVFNPDQIVEYVGAIIVAFITAGSVYAKERLDYAKREEEQRKQNERLSS